MKLEFNIRKLNSRDVTQIIQISKECKLAEWTESAFQSEISREESFIVGVENVKYLVGFLTARFAKHNLSDNSKYVEADLINIGVRNKYLRKGIGTKLLETLIRRCRQLEISQIWLEVRKSNAAARSFYRHKNFTETQERKDFYTNPIEAAVLMKLEIKKQETGKIRRLDS